jgi:hypothetical protein
MTPNLKPGINEFDRVRNHTSDQINLNIDEKIAQQVQQYAKQPDAISQRIEELGREWDTERVLEANASVLAFTGLMLGLFINYHWFWLTGIVLPFLFQHAVQGWCPPLPVIRRLGVRTRSEIGQEKYSLKLLRGDFDSLCREGIDPADKAASALRAVKL